MEEIEVKEKLKEYAAILNLLHSAGIVRTFGNVFKKFIVG